MKVSGLGTGFGSCVLLWGSVSSHVTGAEERCAGLVLATSVE